VDRLAVSVAPAWRLVHGSYKPSQLLFHSGEARVIDWDEMVAGDPALDVGSFLAWLRPSGLWYGRLGSRACFDASAEQFVRAYVRSRLALSVDADEIPDVLERARAYEASKLFKIAVRRVRWRNSPRPGELAAMCQEIAGCLEEPARWREALAGSPE
jgi:aminoglycoside phosphotransferase (APT) family kinase protein